MRVKIRRWLIVEWIFGFQFPSVEPFIIQYRFVFIFFPLHKIQWCNKNDTKHTNWILTAVAATASITCSALQQFPFHEKKRTQNKLVHFFPLHAFNNRRDDVLYKNISATALFSLLVHRSHCSRAVYSKMRFNQSIYSFFLLFAINHFVNGKFSFWISFFFVV